MAMGLERRRAPAMAAAAAFCSGLADMVVRGAAVVRSEGTAGAVKADADPTRARSTAEVFILHARHTSEQGGGSSVASF